MNLIRRHKGLAIIGGLTLILLVIIFAIFSRMIFSTGKGEYGDRLKNIVNISQDTTKKIIDETKELDEVEDIKVRTQGKIVYTTITFTESTSKDRAKEIANKTLEYYSEEEVECYDFEFFLTQKEILDDEGNDKAYTIAGNKHPEKDSISWTRN